MSEAELRCPVSLFCGGCALIDLPYDRQLERKHDSVRQALDFHEELRSLPLLECMPAAQREAYRNRAKLAVDRGSGAVRIGLFRRGSHHLIDLAVCRVQQPSLMRGMELLRNWIDEEWLAAPKGPLFYVDLRQTAGNGCHLTLVADSRRKLPSRWPLDSLIERWPGLCGVSLNLGDPTSSFAMGTEWTTLHGDALFRMRIGEPPGLDFDVPAGGFFQVSVELLPALHETIAGHFSGCSRILDLYCGVGVHGIAVASRMAAAPAVQGIDSSPALVDAARRNAERHGIAATFEVGAVEERTPLVDAAGAAAMLNPGRSGCRTRLLERFAASSIDRIAYLSCSPKSLARDLVGFLRAGYAVERVQPIDLMPQTDQVETLVLMRRAA